MEYSPPVSESFTSPTGQFERERTAATGLLPTLTLPACAAAIWLTM